MIGTMILVIFSILVVLLLIALVRTLRMKPADANYIPTPDPERESLYAEKLSRMVQFETVSVRGKPQPEKFRDFHKVLRELFPTVFEKCEVTEIDGNLLLRWRGESAENPILLLAHQDVVEAVGTWTHEPFSGEIEDGKVWGRGSGDTKGSLMALLQAAEEMIAEGYVPAVDVYLASSCTEEIGGDGAPKLAQYLHDHGIELAMLCDEGGGITEAPLKGLEGKYAMIGMFEKGYGDVKFIARSNGGHSSAPTKGTPIPRLAAFVNEIERRDPFKRELRAEVKAMFSRLAPYCSFGLKYVLGNLWLFGGLMKVIVPKVSAQADAMLKTTICFTMQQGSQGPNVIPQEASVTANLRYIPHQNQEASLAVLRPIAAKYGLDLEVEVEGNPTKPLNLKGRPFLLTEEAIHRCFPKVCVTPYVVVGGTDARHFEWVSRGCVRFSPLIYGPEQMAGMHGLNENLETNCLPGAVDYYKTIVRMQREFPEKK